MRSSLRRFCLAMGVPLALSVLMAAACSKNNVAAPSDTTAAATSALGTLTASVTVPRPLAPANTAKIAYLAQPVVLVVQNAVVTKPDGVTYTFEVSSDPNFGTKTQTKDAVPEGGGGQTSVQLDKLPGGQDYVWHARATGGGTTGPFGATYKFTIGPPVVINPPRPLSPLTGAQVGARPSLSVANASASGPVGPLSYRFEISNNANFNPMLVTATVPESSGQTTYIPTQDLPIQATLYWRATAIDQASAASSAPSAPQSFTTSLTIDLNNVIVSYINAPSGGEVASWPQTATIIAVEQDGNPASGGIMCISFSTTDQWPSIPYFGDPSVPIYANQWYFANIGGQWFGGPGEYLRADRASVCKTGQATATIGPDGGWTFPMRTWAPKVGEMVGFMMSTPARNWPGMHSTNERSNIVLQPWRDTSLGSTAVGRTTASGKR